MNKSEILKKNLLYRSSYRGTKEMDFLLSSFVKFYIDKFTKKELEDLNKLLDLEDEVIFNFYEKNISNDSIKNNSISSHLKKFKIY